MKNKPKEPKQITIKCANIIFMLGILFSILLAIYAIYKFYNPTQSISRVFYIISMLSCGLLATLFGFGLKRLSNNMKVNLSLLFFTTSIAVYGFETYLEFFQDSKREIFAKQMGVSFDTRKNIEVLENLKDTGVEVYLNVGPGQHLTENGVIYNFGGISNSTTIFDNKAGYYPVIETDEHGFNNPKGLYIENKVDVVLTGDDFAEGKSVNSNESIGAVLRQLDFNVISIGKTGNGPLIELAALKEYAKFLKPKIVLWLYYVNDLNELSVEIESSLLRKYLDENDYSQNLIYRQEEIDSVLINFQSQWEKIRMESEKKLKKLKIINTLKLAELRRMINLQPTPISSPTPIFRDILQQSKQMVSGWDGKMYLVYLPAYKRYSTDNEHPNRNFVIQTATELDIPIIDIHREVFKSYPDPLSLFPFKLPYRYNAEGYRLVAEAIGKRIEADGYVPIK